MRNIIVFEGIASSGKTTLERMLAERPVIGTVPKGSDSEAYRTKLLAYGWVEERSGVFTMPLPGGPAN